MNPGELDDNDYKVFLANSFWPAFWECWRRNKVSLTWCTMRCSFVQWRDNESDSLVWFIKSFLKGFNLYFCGCMFACMCVSEYAFFITLSEHLNVRSKDLIEPLFLALPALIGTTLLDYGLEFKKRPIVSVVAFCILVLLGYFAYSFHRCGLSVDSFYYITFGVMFLAWCIKARDPRMTVVRSAASVIPGGEAVLNAKPILGGSIGNGRKVSFERMDKEAGR